MKKQRRDNMTDNINELDNTDKCNKFRSSKLNDFSACIDAYKELTLTKEQPETNNSITPQELYLQYHKSLCDTCRELSKRKQGDYCDLSSDDMMSVFGNFMLPEQMGIITTEQALLSRIADKFNRLITVINNDTCNVDDETTDDTIQDIMNFMVLLSYYRTLTGK